MNHRSNAVDELLRHAEHVVPREDLVRRLEEGERLRVKLGLDPTARDVTLGWAVPLRKLRRFQDLGHTAVLIVGDFTARIGDPSGKSATRPQLEADEVKAFAEDVLDQFKDILSEDHLEIRYNSEWLEPMDLPDLLRLTSHYTVAQMLERDDFSHRYANQQPISLIEFMYPLLQGYDSVAVQADVELGGTDQLFNLLVGRALQRSFGQRPQVALTMPLLVGLDGVQKMSQSLGNYVAIREGPRGMFGKLMSLPDGAAPTYAALAADMDDAEISAVAEAIERRGPGAGEAKRRVARAIVSRYHGGAAAAAAEAAFDRQFRAGQAPQDVPERPIPPSAVDGTRVWLPRVMVELGLASSGGEARRLIEGAGVRLNGETVGSEEVGIDEVRGALLQVGKRRFVRLAR